MLKNPTRLSATPVNGQDGAHRNRPKRGDTVRETFGNMVLKLFAAMNAEKQVGTRQAAAKRKNMTGARRSHAGDRRGVIIACGAGIPAQVAGHGKDWIPPANHRAGDNAGDATKNHVFTAAHCSCRSPYRLLPRWRRNRW